MTFLTLIWSRALPMTTVWNLMIIIPMTSVLMTGVKTITAKCPMISIWKSAGAEIPGRQLLPIRWIQPAIITLTSMAIITIWTGTLSRRLVQALHRLTRIRKQGPRTAQTLKQNQMPPLRRAAQLILLPTVPMILLPEAPMIHPTTVPVI